MALRPLILPAEVGELARPCYADDALLTQIIAESEREDIRPRIGAAIYVALKEAATEEDLTGGMRVLLLGGTWTDPAGKVRYLDGLKTTLAYYVYGRVIRDGNITSTRYGAVIKSDENSNSASDTAERQRQYRQAFAAADTMLTEAVNYIIAAQLGGCEDVPRVTSNRARMSVVGTSNGGAQRCQSSTPTIIAGKEGASAYEVAVAQGFRGSEAEWLASLVGPQGEPGPQGEQGPQGEVGPMPDMSNYYDKAETDALLADKASNEKLSELDKKIGNAVNPIVIELKNGYLTINPARTEATYGVLSTRVLTSVIKGNYRIKVKDGYVIRGVAAWNGGQTSGIISESFSIQAGENLMSGGSITEFINTSDYEYSSITFCKTNASANISPNEDIIDVLEALPSGMIYDLEEAKKNISSINKSINGLSFSLYQGYTSTGTNVIVYGNQSNRVASSVLSGKFKVRTNDGYVIRGVVAWNNGQSCGKITTNIKADNVASLVSGGTSKEFISSDLYEHFSITFCKTDATLDILPTENIVHSIERLDGATNLLQRIEKLEVRSIKNAVFMGDSITHGVYSYFNGGVKDDAHRYNGFDIVNISSVTEASSVPNIPHYFARLAKCNVTNLAKRGSGYVADSRSIGNALAVVNSYDFSNTDFVGLCFGVNDYIQGKNIGNLTDKAEGTLVGNMVRVITKILTDNPLCKVVVYSPYNTFGQVSKGGDYIADTTYGTEEGNYALGYDLNGKGTLQDYINAEDEVCRYYAIQHVKLSESNVCNRISLKSVLIDGLHPSKDAWSRLAAEIYGKSNFGV